jgi:hypothetical protein
LPGLDDQREHPAAAARTQVDLGSEPATRAAERLTSRALSASGSISSDRTRTALTVWTEPPLKDGGGECRAPAAWWCARTDVESTETSQSISPAALLPVRKGRCGRWRVHRQVVNGVLYRIRTGVQWRELPERYGPWKTVHERHRLQPLPLDTCQTTPTPHSRIND